MNLSEYMEAKGLNDGDVAARINRSRVTASRYRRGLEPIPGEVVKELVEWSEGLMTANELLGIQIEAPAASPAQAGAQ